MSHFTVLVIGPDPESQLAPYNEHIEVPRYVKLTKSQVIEKSRKSIDDYRETTYAEFIKDPEKYKSSTTNSNHINYLENEFPKKINWSDEQLYSEAIEYEDPKNIGPDGEIYSTYNPKSKWDWYVLGGRWSGLIKVKDSATHAYIGHPGAFGNAVGIDQCIKSEITNLDELITFAVIKDGVWYERGEMGWWAVVSNEMSDEEWASEVKKLTSRLPDDTLISIYDCHI